MRSSDTGQMTMLTPTSRSWSVEKSSLLPNSVMLARIGTSSAARHRLELLERAHRLGEDRVGTRIHERLGAVDRGVQPLDGPDVGARHDEEVRVAPRIGGGTDALDRGVLVDDGLAVEVAAALRVDLVLDVRAGEPGILERLDRAGDVHRLAEAGVGVDDRGEVGHARDLLRRGRRPRSAS